MNEKIYLETIEELDECKNNDEILQIVLDLKMQNADLGKMVEEANTRLCEELELYKRAFNVATMDLDLCRNHSQTLNDELVERVENLRNTILERIKEKMEG